MARTGFIPRESARTSTLLRHLRSRGCWVVKTHGGPYGAAGTPDILACYCGRFLALEVKRPGNPTTAIQSEQLRRIRQAGGGGHVVWRTADIDAALAIIEDNADAIH